MTVLRATRRDLYPALLAECVKPTTRQAREWDIADFGRFLQLGPVEACATFVAGGRGVAVTIVKGYQEQLLARKLSPSTINRRLSTLRRLVALANELDVIDWLIKPKNLKEQPFRDTRGPGHNGWVKLLEEARRKSLKSDVGRRDLVILRLLHDNMLRRKEVAGLDLVDVDLDAGRVWILGKGRGDKESITLNSHTLLALLKWLDVRGNEPGPLFIRMDRAKSKDHLERMDGDSIRKLTRQLGKKAGLQRPVRPHGLRHQGVTRILELTNGNIEKAQKAARHASPTTTARYNDNRNDVAGEMAQLLGDDA